MKVRKLFMEIVHISSDINMKLLRNIRLMIIGTFESWSGDNDFINSVTGDIMKLSAGTSIIEIDLRSELLINMLLTLGFYSKVQWRNPQIQPSKFIPSILPSTLDIYVIKCNMKNIHYYKKTHDMTCRHNISISYFTGYCRRHSSRWPDVSLCLAQIYVDLPSPENMHY